MENNNSNCEGRLFKIKAFDRDSADEVLRAQLKSFDKNANVQPSVIS